MIPMHAKTVRVAIRMAAGGLKMSKTLSSTYRGYVIKKSLHVVQLLLNGWDKQQVIADHCRSLCEIMQAEVMYYSTPVKQK